MMDECIPVCVQVQLQNILMSKHVEYFLVDVSSWQRRLMLADQVIGTWLGVQRTWAHLQSIFTNSEDIRNQLAHDAELFQGIHLDFQVATQELFMAQYWKGKTAPLWHLMCLSIEIRYLLLVFYC